MQPTKSLKILTLASLMIFRYAETKSLWPKLRHYQRHNSLTYLYYILNDY